MSTLMDDLLNLANEVSSEDRAAQAAVIDSCIDRMVDEARTSSPEVESLKGQVADLEAQLADASAKRDQYRDKFVELYLGKREEPASPQPDNAVKTVRGAMALCGRE